jgi:hypothetical protein
LYQIGTAPYETLVVYYTDLQKHGSKAFRHPLLLTYLIPILVAGWKDAGLWPSEENLRQQILEKRLNPQDYDLSVHLASVLDDKDEEFDSLLTTSHPNGKRKGDGGQGGQKGDGDSYDDGYTEDREDSETAE